MDRWRTLAITFGGLWALTLVGLAVALFAGSSDADTTDAPAVIAADGSAGRGVDAAEERSRAEPRDPLARLEPGARPLVATSGDDTVPAWVADPSQPLPDDVMERAREQLRSERDEQREERRDQMADEIDAFIEDEGLSDEQAEKLRDTLDAFRDKMDTMRDSMRSGDADFREVRSTMRDARDQLSTELDTQLGSEGADRLRERMFGGNAGFGPRRPPL